MKIKTHYFFLSLVALLAACLTFISPFFNYVLGRIINLFSQSKNYPLTIFLFFLYSAALFFLLSCSKYSPQEKQKKGWAIALFIAIILFFLTSLTSFAKFLTHNKLPFNPKIEYSFLHKKEIVSTSLRNLRLLTTQSNALLSLARVDQLSNTLNPKKNPQLPIFLKKPEPGSFSLSFASPVIIILATIVFFLIAILLAINLLALGSSISRTKYAALTVYILCSFSLLKNLLSGTLFEPETIVSLLTIFILLSRSLLSFKNEKIAKIFFLIFCGYALLMHTLFHFFIFFKTTSLCLLYVLFFVITYFYQRKKIFYAFCSILICGILFYLTAWGGGPSLVLDYDYAFFKKASSADRKFFLTMNKNLIACSPIIKTNEIGIYQIPSTSCPASIESLIKKNSLDLRESFYPLKAFGTEECNVGGDPIGNGYYAITGYLKLVHKNVLNKRNAKHHHAGWWVVFKEDEKNLFDYIYFISIHKCISSFNKNLALFIIKNLLKTDKFIIAHYENF